MFRALLDHPQEALHKRHFVCCVRVMSVGCYQGWSEMEYGVSARVLKPYPGDLNHCRSCIPASEDGLKEIPKHVRQK
jgi:hypothetical protein